MKFRLSQLLLAAELGIFALGPTFMALFGFPYLMAASLNNQASGITAIFWLAPVGVSLLALVALWRIALSFIAKDTGGLLRIGHVWWGMLSLGPLVIGAGVVAILADDFSSEATNLDNLKSQRDALDGLVMTAFMGAKVLVPCIHVAFEKWRGWRLGQRSAV
jgi:hypothetical protein